MSPPRLAALSSPTAEITPRKRVLRGLAGALASSRKGWSPSLTGKARLRVSTNWRAATGFAQASGVWSWTWKIVLPLCQSVRRGGPKLISSRRGAGRL